MDELFWLAPLDTDDASSEGPNLGESSGVEEGAQKSVVAKLDAVEATNGDATMTEDYKTKVTIGDAATTEDNKTNGTNGDAAMAEANKANGTNGNAAMAEDNKAKVTNGDAAMTEDNKAKVTHGNATMAEANKTNGTKGDAAMTEDNKTNGTNGDAAMTEDNKAKVTNGNAAMENNGNTAMAEDNKTKANNGDAALAEDNKAKATIEAKTEATACEKKTEVPIRKGVKRKRYEEYPIAITEDEPEMNDGIICLDWYNSDLSLRINKSCFMLATPLYKDGWGLVWSGARATHGFTSGKIYYEVKLVQELKVQHGEDLKHDLRAGWSTAGSGLMLGESQLSYAYSSSAKKATDSIFEDYGVNVIVGDVIGVYLDLESDPVTISFSKNGEPQGSAFQIKKSELEGKPLFPHVSTLNIQFEVNFGRTKSGIARERWFSHSEEFVFAANVKEPVRGPPRISKREFCEMVMLVGLPASGKTTWVNHHINQHPEKQYTLIGAASLIDRMKVNGEPLKPHCTNWPAIIQKVTRCLADLLQIAATRRRNYIIDQTNVYSFAQKRKIRPFQGMIRKAVVVVPSDEDYKTRIEAQENAEVKEVPDTTIMELKANFSLPEEPESGETPLFSEIIFVELNREEASKLVEEYNKDAKSKGFGKSFEKQQEEHRKKHRGMYNSRGGQRMRGNTNSGRQFGRFQQGMPFYRRPQSGPMTVTPMRNQTFGSPHGYQFGGYFHQGNGSPFGQQSGNMMMSRGRSNQRFGGGNKFDSYYVGSNQGMGGGQWGQGAWQNPQSSSARGRYWSAMGGAGSQATGWNEDDHGQMGQQDNQWNSAGNGWGSPGNRWGSSGNGWTSSGNGWASSGNGWTSSSNGWASSGNGWTSSGNARRSGEYPGNQNWGGFEC